MITTKVGIREFRENLSTYLESKTPVAITRHGDTIGVYLPTRPKPSQADIDAFRIAGKQMRKLIEETGTSEKDLLKDFEKARRKERKKSRK